MLSSIVRICVLIDFAMVHFAIDFSAPPFGYWWKTGSAAKSAELVSAK